MPNINIGSSGYISYTINNNICYSGSGGSIVINNIYFDNLYQAFRSYTIDWSPSGAFNDNQIRNNGSALVDLPSGLYLFTIQSLIFSGVSLGPYSVPITEPEEFKITNLIYPEYVCDDNDGHITVYITGGAPPYTFNIGASEVIQTGSIYGISGVGAGEYAISVIDINGCSATDITAGNIDYSTATLTYNSFYITNYTALQPEVKGGKGYFSITLEGNDPFDFVFDNGNERISVSGESYLSEYDSTNNRYSYIFPNLLSPGSYSIKINNSTCSIEDSVYIPYLSPINVNLAVSPDYKQNLLDAYPLLPIFDTIFLPYKFIQNNSELWQLIQQSIKNGKIDFKIDDKVITYAITRNFLFPDCVNQEIELVRLDNNEENLFFCFHIGPGINIANETNILNSNIFLFDKKNNIEYSVILGLEDKKISNEKISLLIGSLCIGGITNFYDNSEIYFSLSSIVPRVVSEDDILIKNTKINNYFRIYNLGFTTNIYFLENFNILTQNININNTACTIPNEYYQYTLSIKKLLLLINNINNYNKLFAYNIVSENNGFVSVSIDADSSIIKDGISRNNIFNIEYYTFNEFSTELESFYQNNTKINGPFLGPISDNYIIIRIKDTNNNTPDNVSINDSAYTDYNEHFSQASHFINQYNPKILQYFEYGDILVSLFVENYQLPETPITSTEQYKTIIFNQDTIDTTSRIIFSQDTIDTSRIIISTFPNDSVCYLVGPKQYKQKFIGPTIFENVVPGVYNIIGDEDFLSDNFLYNNNTKLIVLKNQEYNLVVQFVSYKGLLLIKK